MGGLLVLWMSLQSTLGPGCLLNEQAVLPDSCLEVMEPTIYLPTVLVSELIPPVGAAVEAIVLTNREVFPARRAATLSPAYYLADDIQYFPQGPEFKLRKQDERLPELEQGGSR